MIEAIIRNLRRRFQANETILWLQLVLKNLVDNITAVGKKIGCRFVQHEEQTPAAENNNGDHVDGTKRVVINVR